jgi:hypothetical protein
MGDTRKWKSAFLADILSLKKRSGNKCKMSSNKRKPLNEEKEENINKNLQAK